MSIAIRHFVLFMNKGPDRINYNESKDTLLNGQISGEPQNLTWAFSAVKERSFPSDGL